LDRLFRLGGGNTAEAFWSWFAKAAPKIARDYAAFVRGGGAPDVLLKDVGKQLRRYSPGLVAEIGKAGETFDLVISADGIRANIEPVLALVRAAPQIAGWKVTAFRSRKTLAAANLQLGPLTLHRSDVRFRLGDLDDGHCDLIIAFREKILPPDMDPAFPGFLLTDIALGEYDVMTRIGAVDFAVFDAVTLGDFLPFDQLPEQLDRQFPPLIS
jgi:hypothetical protein